MKNLLYIIFITIFAVGNSFSQDSLEIKRKKALDKILQASDTTKLKELREYYGSEYAKKRKAAIKWAKEHNLPIVKKLPDGRKMELQRLDKEGKPVYYISHNVNAAKTVSTDKVQLGGSSGLNLTGSGIDIGIWDEGLVYEEHNSLYPQVELIDTDSIEYGDHATHVAGTMIANGVEANAKGMAPNAKLLSYQWNNDFAEMTAAAISIPGVQRPMILSNHSYGLITGWEIYGDDWVWFGNNGALFDHNFGYYNSKALALDALLYNAPFYTVIWSAGNDRGQGPELGTPHKHADSSGTFTDLHQKDGGTLGFDCISGAGLAKNIITVGAVDDIISGYQGTLSVKQQNTKFSSWGPTDDGRIKPDIVANGDSLYSTFYYVKDDSGNVVDSGSVYAYDSGTSMAAPNVTGSLALLQQYYQSTHTQGYMKAPTLKALVIHTADEAGDYPGPDFKFGWGLLNTNKAAEVISLDANVNNTIQELQLQNGQTYTLNVKPIGQGVPLKVTIAWTDPPAQTSSVLVNDLDLKIVQKH